MCRSFSKKRLERGHHCMRISPLSAKCPRPKLDAYHGTRNGKVSLNRTPFDVILSGRIHDSMYLLVDVPNTYDSDALTHDLTVQSATS